MEKRSAVVLFLAILFLSTGLSQGHSHPERVSDPEKVNEIIPEIDTPKMDPGDSGVMRLILNNPYNETIEDVNFTIDIYEYAYLGEEKDISEIDEPPVFEKSEKTNITFFEDSMSPGFRENLEYKIEAEDGTEEGVYLLRVKLEFVYLENEVLMKSRGYFTGEEWDDAKVEDEEYPGGFNLTELGVDGILSDSSFSVKSSLPRWPQYTLGAILGVSAILAVVFYMQEKHGSFPRLEKAFDKGSGKLEKIRRNFKKRFD